MLIFTIIVSSNKVIQCLDQTFDQLSTQTPSSTSILQTLYKRYVVPDDVANYITGQSKKHDVPLKFTGSHHVFVHENCVFKLLSIPDRGQSDEYPGNDVLVYYLYDVLGFGQYVLPTELAHLIHRNKNYWLQISPLIGSENLADRLHRKPYYRPSTKSYSIHFLMTLLLNLGDAKGENYVPVDTVTCTDLVSIDHEMCFRHRVVNHYKNRGNLPGINSILFLWDDYMHAPVTLEVQQLLLKESAAWSIVNVWKQKIKDYNDQLKNLGQPYHRLNLPIAVSEMEQARILAHLHILQDLFRTHDYITHDHLLSLYMPDIAELYTKLRYKRIGLSKSVPSSNNHQCDSLFVINHLTYHLSNLALHIPKRTDKGFVYQSLFFDGRRINLSEQKKFLTELLKKRYQYLFIQYCLALKQVLIQQNLLSYEAKNKLTHLWVSHCHLDANHLNILFRYCPHLQYLDISHNPIHKISSVQCSNLKHLNVSHCDALKVIEGYFTNLEFLSCSYCSQLISYPKVRSPVLNTIVAVQSKFLSHLSEYQKAFLTACSKKQCWTSRNFNTNRELNFCLNYLDDQDAQDTVLLYLAQFHQPGGVFDEHPEKAFELFYESQLLGNASAMYQLSLCYKNGWGTATHKHGAKYFMDKAKHYGHTISNKCNLEKVLPASSDSKFCQIILQNLLGTSCSPGEIDALSQTVSEIAPEHRPLLANFLLSKFDKLILVSSHSFDPDMQKLQFATHIQKINNVFRLAQIIINLDPTLKPQLSKLLFQNIRPTFNLADLDDYTALYLSRLMDFDPTLLTQIIKDLSHDLAATQNAFHILSLVNNQLIPPDSILAHQIRATHANLSERFAYDKKDCLASMYIHICIEEMYHSSAIPKLYERVGAHSPLTYHVLKNLLFYLEKDLREQNLVNTFNRWSNLFDLRIAEQLYLDLFRKVSLPMAQYIVSKNPLFGSFVGEYFFEATKQFFKINKTIAHEFFRYAVSFNPRFCRANYAFDTK